MPTQPHTYQFTFASTMEMDAGDISEFASEHEQSINDWIDYNTPYNYANVPVEIRRHIVQCIYDKIMSTEWKWE